MPQFHYGVKVSETCDNVFKVLKNVENFSTFMTAVKKIDILKKDGNILNTKWTVDFDGVFMEWIEEMVFDQSSYTVGFKTISGDFTRNGRWKIFEDSGTGKSCISLDIDYNWDAPNFEHFFGDVYSKKADKAAKSMLYALRKQVNK